MSEENPDIPPELTPELARSLQEQVIANQIAPTEVKERRSTGRTPEAAAEDPQRKGREERRAAGRAKLQKEIVDKIYFAEDADDLDEAAFVQAAASRIAETAPTGAFPMPENFGEPAGLPPQLPDAVIPSGDQLPVLPAGFYLMFGATGGGKSIGAACIAQAYARTNRVPPIGFDADSNAWGEPYISHAAAVTRAAMKGEAVQDAPILPGYLYVYEARAWQGFFNASPIIRKPGEGFSGVEDWSGPHNFFRRLSWALGDSDGIIDSSGLTRAKAWSSHRLGSWYEYFTATNAPTLLIIDSITLPMRAYASGVAPEIGAQPTRQGEATMPQGLQPSDIAFCEQMQALAAENHLVMIGLVNSELVPFADKLEGVCEGMIEVDGPGVLRIRSRRDRAYKLLDLTANLKDAAKFLQYKDPSVIGRIPGFQGL